MKKKKDEITIHSSAAEYLTYVRINRNIDADGSCCTGKSR